MHAQGSAVDIQTLPLPPAYFHRERVISGASQFTVSVVSLIVNRKSRPISFKKAIGITVTPSNDTITKPLEIPIQYN